MKSLQEIINKWNNQADEFNQWDSLGEDEKIEFAQKEGDHYKRDLINLLTRIFQCGDEYVKNKGIDMVIEEAHEQIQTWIAIENSVIVPIRQI